MAKVGVGLKINLSNIDKTKLFKGEKGTYLDATVFIDLDNKDQHGKNGMITQDWKDAPKGQTPILGNVNVFWSDSQQPQNNQQSNSQGFASDGRAYGTQQRQQQQAPQNNPPMAEPDFDFDDKLGF